MTESDHSSESSQNKDDEAAASFKLTDFGRSILEAHDESRRDRIQRHRERTAEDIADLFRRNISPDNVVMLSYWEFYDAFGPFLRSGMPDVIESEAPPQPHDIPARPIIPIELEREGDL